MNKSKAEQNYSVSVSVLEQINRYLIQKGVDTNNFFKSVGIDPKILLAPDERITVQQYVAIEEQAALITNDECYGVHMGQFAEAGNWSILGYMMMNCNTINDAFRKFEKYSVIIGNLIRGEYHTGTNTVAIVLSIPENAPEISKHCYQGYFSSMVRLARTLSGKNINPLEVGFTYKKPDYINEYERIFGCNVLFEQEQNYLILSKEVVETPVISPNKNLLEYFENYAKEFLAKLEPSKMTYKVKHLLLSNMDDDNMTIRNVAKKLAVSVRTLQAHLKKEDTEFSELLRSTREQLAKKYIKENYSVEDITYLIGFSDPSTFRKAFKKWTGFTPKEFREIKT